MSDLYERIRVRVKVRPGVQQVSIVEQIQIKSLNGDNRTIHIHLDVSTRVETPKSAGDIRGSG
jgi:hypothetical protein